MTSVRNCTAYSFEGPEIPIYSRIAILSSLSISSSRIGSTLLYIVSQIQLLAIIFASAIIDLRREGFANADVKRLFENIPAFFDFEESPEKVKVLCALLFIFGVYIILSVILLAYYCMKLRKKEMMDPLLIKILSMAVKLQESTFFFLIYIISLKLMSSFIQDKVAENSVIERKKFVIPLSVFVLTVNFFYTLSVLILFSVKVKTKNSFSAKTKAIGALDFAYKSLLPLAWVFQDYSDVYSSILLIVALIYCLIRNLMFFQLLPFYKVRILKYDAISHALLTSSAFSALIAKPISVARSYTEFHVIVLLWIVVGFSLVKLYLQVLKRLFLRILRNPEKVNSYQLLHYYTIYKHFSRAIPASKQDRDFVKENYLHYSAMTCKVVDSQEEDLDVYFLRVTLQLWEDHINKNHDLGLLKVMLAYYYSKKKGQYLLANHILEKNFKSGFALQTSYCLVKLSIYHKLKHEGETDREGDFKRSLEIQNIYRNLKSALMKRLDSEMKFWKLFQTISPDFLVLLSFAKEADSIDRNLKRQANQNEFVFLEAGFTLPLLVCSLYFSFVKHDITNGQRFIRLYCNKVCQQQNMIIQESDHSTTSWRNFVFVISASYEKMGKVLDCSGHVGNLLCFEKEKLIGKAFSSILPHLYAQSFDNLMKTLYKESKSKFLDNKIMLPIRVDSGNGGSGMMFCWLYMTLIYLPEYGFCFHVLLMPIKSKERLAVVSASNGAILNVSKEFLDDMNISNKEAALNIADFCPDFERFLSLSSATSAPLKERQSRRFVRSKTKTLGDPSTSLISSWLHSERGQSPEGKTKDDPFWRTDDKEGVRRSIKLTFHPYSAAPPGSERTPRSSAKIKDDPLMQVDYQVDLVEKTLQQTRIFELRMKRIKDDKDLSPKKSFRSFTRFFEKDAPLQVAHAQTLMTGMSTTSPLKPALKNRPTFTNMKTMFSTEEIKFTTEVDNYQPVLATLSPNKKNRHQLTSNNNNNKPSLKVLTHEPTFGTLMSPVSESRKLVFPTTNGDLEDVYQPSNLMEEEDLPRPLSSKNDCEAGNQNNEIVDAKMLETNLTGRVLGEDESAENDDDDIGSIILFKKKIEAHRRLRKIIQSKKYPKSALYYLLGFAFTQASLFVFLVWLNFNVSEISNTAEQLNQVITDFYFRSYHTELLNQDIMMLLALRSSADLSQYMDWGVDAATIDIYNLTKANAKLSNSLTYLDEEIQQSFYDQNIRMYERNASGELQQIGKANLFQSVQKIIDNGFANMARDDFAVPGPFYINPNMMFILDNSMNDLLIAGEEMLARLERKLYDYFDNSRAKLQVSLSLILSVLIIFMFATLAMVLIVRKDTFEFMEKMFVLPHEVTSKIEKRLGLFKEALERDSYEGDILSIYSLHHDSRDYNHSKGGRKKRSHDTNTGNKRTIRTPSENVLKKFSRRNALLFFLLLLCLALTVGCVMIYYKQALRRVTVMNKQQSNLNYALNFINFLGQFMPAVEITVLLNATTNFRNMPVLEGISSQLKRFKKLDEIQESLKDADGEYSETQKEILFGYDCNKVYTPLYPWPEELMLLECDFASNGLGRISLTKVLTTLEIVLEQFLVQFEQVRYDMDSMLQFYGEYVIQVISYLIDMGFLLMLRSFVASRDDFSSLSKELERQRILLGWISFLISIVLGTMTWIFVVRKLLRREFERKRILALVPSKIIFGNFVLKNYVKRLACHPNDDLKNLGEIL